MTGGIPVDEHLKLKQPNDDNVGRGVLHVIPDHRYRPRAVFVPSDASKAWGVRLRANRCERLT